MTSGVIERPAELRALMRFLLSMSEHPAGLAIEGDAGIGKTTLWLSGVAAARERGYHVISARAGAAETVLAYTTIADLLGDVDHTIVERLPEVQRLAVDRVLLRTTAQGPSTDESVVAAAFAAIVTRLSATAPVLVAIDDVQWLDPSSHAVLAAVARRFTGPIGLLLTERTEHEGEGAAVHLRLGSGRFDTLRVGPLSLRGLHTLISQRLGRSFPRPTMARIAEISAGNPFYALELARAIDAGGSLSKLPATLAELMRMRIGRLDTDAQHLLLAAASASNPTVELIARVTGTDLAHTAELLGEAAAKGIITVDGNEVRFTHPLLARAVYTDATPSRRRAVHRALAETSAMLELRARPMALAALDSAAAAAGDRGAPAAAAELVELAIGLGGDTPLRRIRAADYHLHAGDLQRTRQLLDGVLNSVPAGADRARALNLLAAIHIHGNDFGRAVNCLEEALANSSGGQLRVQTLLLSAYALMNSGEIGRALRSAERAVTYAEQVGDPGLLSQVLAVRATIGCMSGRGVDMVSLRRALAMEDPHSDAPLAFRAEASYALMLSWLGELDAARERLAQVRRQCVDRGAETDLVLVAVYGTLIELWSGHYDAAGALAAETFERAQQLGGDHFRVLAHNMLAVVAAHTGREQDVRENARAAIELAKRYDSPRLPDWAVIALGFLEVSLGRHEQALQVLGPLIERLPREPGTEIISAAYLPDAVEALVSLGHHDRALPLIEALESNGRLLDRPWMLATAARCRSLWLATRGDVSGAVARIEEALRHHDRLPMPFERARTLLLAGQLRRRQRKREAARTALAEAVRIFADLGAPLWAERARAELARTFKGRSGLLGLTASEQRVAELAAEGLTTKDIAVALFVSPKTVESNLTRIYRKLRIRTRAELGRLISDAAARELGSHQPARTRR